MFKRLFLVSIMNFVAVSAVASEVCTTLPECQHMKTQLTTSLAAVNAKIQQLKPSPQFSDIARHHNGSPKYMTQSEAIEYCKKRGQHLPSAKELASLPSTLGAVGISETKIDQSCFPVNAKNRDGTVDSFYICISGYTRPLGDLGNNWFWSSSADLTIGGNGYGLSGTFGGISSFNLGFMERGAVRCAIN